MFESSASDFFDSYANDFNDIYGNSDNLVNWMINRLFRQAMRIRFEKSIEGCQPVEGRTVLDVGCGPGHYSVELAEQGAERVVGIDFSDSMIDIARGKAEEAGVEDRCEFICQDFLDYEPNEPFDYSIVTGVMDYIKWARHFVDRVLDVTRRRAFFSFPSDGGVLALQRKVRYKFRCPLYLYERSELEEIFEGVRTRRVELDEMPRGFFVTAHPERSNSQ